jgi:hypothetical protein
VRQIDSALKPLWRSPNEEYQALFRLQELTRKTVALNLVAKVKEMSDRIDEKGKAIASAALSSSLDLAAAILDQILVELKRHRHFETTIRRRSSFWEYFRIICDRGHQQWTPIFTSTGFWTLQPSLVGYFHTKGSKMTSRAK